MRLCYCRTSYSYHSLLGSRVPLWDTSELLFAVEVPERLRDFWKVGDRPLASDPLPFMVAVPTLHVEFVRLALAPKDSEGYTQSFLYYWEVRD